MYRLILNSVQDYPVDRTLGLKYLVRREFQLSMDNWFEEVLEVRNRYAAAHNLPQRSGELDWQDETSASLSEAY